MINILKRLIFKCLVDGGVLLVVYDEGFIDLFFFLMFVELEELMFDVGGLMDYLYFVLFMFLCKLSL